MSTELAQLVYEQKAGNFLSVAFANYKLLLVLIDDDAYRYLLRDLLEVYKTFEEEYELHLGHISNPKDCQCACLREPWIGEALKAAWAPTLKRAGRLESDVVHFFKKKDYRTVQVSKEVREHEMAVREISVKNPEYLVIFPFVMYSETTKGENLVRSFLFRTLFGCTAAYPFDGPQKDSTKGAAFFEYNMNLAQVQAERQSLITKLNSIKVPQQVVPTLVSQAKALAERNLAVKHSARYWTVSLVIFSAKAIFYTIILIMFTIPLWVPRYWHWMEKNGYHNHDHSEL
ncbi:uncharacterized protein BJ171DRAFT_570590 [Polychytrium aggregatum]|uniref:uncharacterized protein n=1 Tax=Polychytrium aggregatum TaxID=110093 RepID=UPI0022FE7AF7|nr:uncharacterized protein BJ171DRAFT_570590 [Polychytrium aggregatum]KAI9199408.1 hypothetical protein BJ171DRAFT_570590 [Polychytrium aggregatum]